jgi:DNA (cytosine-5)-methyltransferase 1
MNLKQNLKQCGTMFRLGVFRHRLFESNVFMMSPGRCIHDGKIGDGQYFSVAGGAGRWKSWGQVKRDVSKGTADQWRHAMGIDWMTRNEIREAIPPAYPESIHASLCKFHARR